MSGINKINNFFDVLESTGAKYLAEGYVRGKLSEVVYHDPENQEQEEIAKKIANRHKNGSYVLYIFSVFCIVIAILSIIMKVGNIWFIGCMIVISAVLVYTSIDAMKMERQKTKIITGKAISKQIRKTSSSGRVHRNKRYYVTIIPDSGEKVIYDLIPISRDDYQRTTEGTPIMVVNKGPYACVLTHNI